MTNALLAVIALLLAAEVVMRWISLHDLLAADRAMVEYRKSEADAQAAMDAAVNAVVRDKETERERQDMETSALFDEGFENIMRFSVNGKTGFETGGR